MSDSQVIPVSMNAVSAQYMPRVTVFTFDGSNGQVVIAADPRRYYLRIELYVGSGLQTVWPSPGIPDLATTLGGPFPVEYKWRDCPSITTGAFQGSGMPGTSIVIFEDLYVGG